MRDDDFVLDPRLAVDTSPVGALPLCDLLLMNDARYPWLVLVPRRARMVEITDLTPQDQATLWVETAAAATALRGAAPCEKLNIGALGIIVRQLHIHVVARNANDSAWPAPVWGQGHPLPYEPARRLLLIRHLCNALSL